MTLPQAVDFFLLDQRLRGSTEKTIAGYRGFLGLFVTWLAGYEIYMPVELTLHHVQRYQLYIGGRQCDNKPQPLTRRTVRTYMLHIRVFLAFLHKRGLMSEPIHLYIQLPKTEKPMIEILTDEESICLLSSFDNDENADRDRAVVCLMLDCGLRLSEVAGIRVGDINRDAGYVKVIGKGRKTRIVPIGRKVMELLQEYIYHRPVGPTLFAMTSNAIAQMMKRTKNKTGIARLHAHLLRHTFATNYLIHGLGDVYELSRILGHSDLKITEGYLQLANYYKLLRNRSRQTYLDNLEMKKPRKL
jgi:integrase/recombinase XerC/integrase/recombinase XerD